MRARFTIIPEFLKNPEAFYQSVQQEQNLLEKLRSLFLSILTFLAVFGFVTGLSHSIWQALASAVKVPLIILVGLAFTLPALYFFALALLGIRLSLLQALTVILSGVGVTSFLLLGLAPVSLFFVITTSNYPFFQVLAVLAVALSGFVGMYYLLRGITRVAHDEPGVFSSMGRLLMTGWVGLYGFVAAQMTWRLTPLIADPTLPFYLLNPSKDNFFIDAINAFNHMLGRGSMFLDGLMFMVLLAGGGLLALAIGFGAGSRGRKRRQEQVLAAEAVP
jgi:hypothetical protein